jgi:hypothetical protein
VSKPSWFSENAAIFFPEVLPAAFYVLISPIWEIQLIGRGQMVAALILLAGVTACSYSFYCACRNKLRWMAYAAILGSLLTACVTSTLEFGHLTL